MDAKKIGLWTIFGLALAYLIASLGWAGSRMAKCDLQYNIEHEANEEAKKENGKDSESFDKTEKELLATNNLCQAKGEGLAYENYYWKNINKVINNVKFQKDDVVSSAGVSMLGYIVVYSILLVAVALGIFGTVKDNKTMMTVFSALFLISALTLFSFEIVLLAQSVHQRNAYSSAAVEEYGEFYNLENVAKKASLPQNELIEHKASTIEDANKLVSDIPEQLKKLKEDIKNAKENKNEEQKKKDAKTYKNQKNKFNAHTTHTGFTFFSNAFAETAFLTAAAVAGFMLFKA